MYLCRTIMSSFRLLLLGCLFFGAAVFSAEAATLSLSPGSNVYSSGDTFTVRVAVNSAGASINAAEGTIRFNPGELSVVNVSRSNSIFNLWVAEPTFSNSNGTISFSGGLPSGYTGSNGTIMNITFRAVGSGAARVTFANGSVLANDGRGTNVLSSMNGGTYTIQAASTEPREEVIVEYVAPANTPAAPVVTSRTHPDEDAWSKSRTAELEWTLPPGITGVRTLLSDSPTAVPNIVYDTPITSRTIELEEGVQYFHIQFRNADGWGRVTHYRLAVDSEAPSEITISSPEPPDFTKASQELVVAVSDATSEVNSFLIRINADEPFPYTRETASSTITLPPLDPGYHTVIIEAFDEAGNSIVGSYSFTIEAFTAPTFTNPPTEVNEGVIPVITGLTRPNATVEITVRYGSSDPLTYTVPSDEGGVFTFISEFPLSSGVYLLTAQATDAAGAKSAVSEPIRIAVQQPGYLRLGGLIVNFLSVFITLVALTLLLGFTIWYGFVYFRRFRRRVQVESSEALTIVKKEFALLLTDVTEQAEVLQSSRKTKKLTKAEEEVFAFMTDALRQAELRIEKEVQDITDVLSGDEQNK